MKKLDWNFKILIAIIAVLGLSLSILAQPPHRGYMPRQSVGMGPGLLDLTEEQKEQIKEIRLAHVKDVQPLRDQVKINRAKINALLHQDDPDMDQIVSLVEENGELLVQLQVKSIEQKISVRSLLTDEQKTIFDSQGEKMRNRMAFAEHYRHTRGPQRSRF